MGWDDVAAGQDGVISRQQALAIGVTLGEIRSHLRAGRWRRVGRAVYATFSGPVPRAAQLWAAVLEAGDDAMLSHETAAELQGLADRPSVAIHVTIPGQRRAVRSQGTRLYRSDRAATTRHPTRTPPQTRIEHTVVDLTQAAPDAASAVAWVVRACARRLTTVDRLRATVDQRAKLRHRPALVATLDEVSLGCHSPLELAYLRRVERAHGLPAAGRQVARARRGGRWYDDVHYRRLATLVELDGSAAHPAEWGRQDNHRDNAGVVAGFAVLRYQVADVLDAPCAVAGQVARVLRRNGWRGSPRRCGPDCMIAEDLGTGDYPDLP